MIDFFHLVFARIFWQPMYQVALAILVLPLLWGVLALLAEWADRKRVPPPESKPDKKAQSWEMWRRLKQGHTPWIRGFKGLNLILCLGAVCSVFCMTILGRSTADRAVYLVPFHFLTRRLIYPLIYRSMLLNVLLFVPLGMTLSFLLPERVRHWMGVTVGFSCVLSVVVEVSQYAFSLGYCDVDDVMMNTLGALVGCLARWIFMHCERRTTDNVENRQVPEEGMPVSQ